MSVYNGETYLREALDSILAQTFSDFEVICVDDGSVDATPAILADRAARDARVRVLTQQNQGLIASLNSGFQAARGRLIARMDDDDISHVQRFQRQVEFMDAHPEIGILGTIVSYMDAAGDSTGGKWPRSAPPSFNGWTLLFETNLCHPTVLMRRDVLEGLDDGTGPYRAGALHAEDYELWTRALFTTRIANLSDTLLTRRKWQGTIGSQHAERQERTVIEAMKQAHQRLLGRAVPYETVALVRHSVRNKNMHGMVEVDQTPTRLEEAALLIRDLCEAYLKAFRVEADVAARVRRDAAEKLWWLASRARSQSAASSLAILNIVRRVDTRLLVSKISNRLKRGLVGS